MLRKFLLYFKLLVVLFCIIIFNGCTSIRILWGNGSGSLKTYQYSQYSKKEVNNAIQCFYKAYNKYIPPEKYKTSMIHYYPDLKSTASQKANADTVQFHFYVINENKENILYWTSFVGPAENEWLKKPTELALVGYEMNSKQIMDKDYGLFKFKFKSRDKNIKLFETEILPKIRYYLEHPEECEQRLPTYLQLVIDNLREKKSESNN